VRRLIVGPLSVVGGIVNLCTRIANNIGYGNNFADRRHIGWNGGRNRDRHVAQ
jgi:hypothetical protein